MSHKLYKAIVAVSVMLLAACGAPPLTTSMTPVASPSVAQSTATPLPQPTNSPMALPIQPTPLPKQTLSPTPVATSTTAPTATFTRATLAASPTPTVATPRSPVATATGVQAGSDLGTIPVPKGAALSSSSSKAYTYQTDLSVDAVAAFYTSMPPTNGWRYGNTDPSSANPKYIALMRDGSGRPGAVLTIQSSKTSPGMTELVIRSFP